MIKRFCWYVFATMLVTGMAFGQGVDPGYPGYRGWGDPVGKGASYYCRIIGVQGNYTATCTNIAKPNLKPIESARIDRGFEWGASWVDINRDGKTDYCRLIDSDEKPRLACNLATGSGFSSTLESAIFSDAGYHDIRGWIGGKSVSQYCRGVGDHNHPEIKCQQFSIKGGKLVLK